MILAVSFTIFQMTTLYNQWQDDPVITTLETAALPIENIEFTAITICPQGSVNGILSSVLFKQLKEYIISQHEKSLHRKIRSIPKQESNKFYSEVSVRKQILIT